jgi:MATE family multidrug resistance protein
MTGPLYVLLIASPINIFLQWLLVWSRFSLGFIGAPIASIFALTQLQLSTFSFHLCQLYIFDTSKVHLSNDLGGDAWGGWEWKDALDLRQIWTLVVLGFPGIIMLCSEWLSLFHNQVGF